MILTNSITIWFMNACFIFEHGGKLLLLNIVFGSLIRIPLCYLMIITWGFQMPGYFYTGSIIQV